MTICAGALLAMAWSLSATALEGRIEKVLDGDSLIASVGGQSVEMRLADVDAPEHGQAYGEEARHALQRLVERKAVTISVRKRDQYGRWVVDLAVGGRAVDYALVEGGHVWVYRRYNRDRALVALEERARAERRGLWGQNAADIEAPWDWRHAARPQPEPGAGGPIIANRRSRIYHLPQCPSYGSVSANNQVRFASERAAVAAGYRRAGNCS